LGRSGIFVSEVQIRVRSSEIDDLQAEFPQKLAMAEASIIEKIRERGRALIQGMLGIWSKGALAQSLDVEITGEGIKIFVGEGLEYTDAVFFGAEPHWIYPRTGKALHWHRGGGEFYYGRVFHPGQRARHDIIEAVAQMAQKIARDEIAALLKAWRFSG
jgi:hypothetical protein